jgi:small-conductance mechanosensitive channel
MSIAVLSIAEIIQQYLNLGQIASEYIAFVLILVLAVMVAWIGHSIFKRYLIRWAARTESKLDDEILHNIRAPIFLFAILFGVYYGLEGISSLNAYAGTFAQGFAVSEILVVAFIITRITNVLISWYAEDSVKRGRNVSNHLLFVLKKVVQFVVLAFALFAILAVFSVDLSGVVVGLGVGGIAIALALQSILSDAFSAFSIYFDRPFEIGDFIVVGNYSGTVNKVGIKSTRIQLLQGEELIISNKELTSQSVRNFKKLKRRRIAFDLKVTYDTPIEKLKKIPKIVEKATKGIELAELGRVHFKQFGDFSLDFEVVYYIETGDYDQYMDVQQSLNYGIMEGFEKEGIDMAYPTQKIFYTAEARKSD